jgi:hypothetical protein
MTGRPSTVRAESFSATPPQTFSHGNMNRKPSESERADRLTPCERLSNRLDDLARREGLDSNDEITRLLLKFMFDDDGEITNSNGAPTNQIRLNPTESDP